MKKLTTLEYADILMTTELKQGPYNLCKNDRYCCLGVGAFSASFESRSNGEEIEFYCPDTKTWSNGTICSFISDLPEKMKVPGQNNIRVMFLGKWESLTTLNDYHRADFKLIGELIRDTFLMLQEQEKERKGWENL